MRIAEEILLLLVDSTKLDNVLAGAVLVELATIERVGFAPAGGRLKRGRMVVLDPTPPGDPCWIARWPRSRPVGLRSPIG